jgi:hypothetical protein
MHWHNRTGIGFRASTTLTAIDPHIEHWRNHVKHTISQLHQVPEGQVRLTNKPAERLRMLTWKAWCYRYHISLTFILETLLRRFSYIRPIQPGSLNMPITTLTGPKAQEILEQEILKTFPNGENLEMERCSLRQKMLASPATIKAPHDQTRDEFLAAYHQGRKSRVDKRLVLAETMQRRHWRNNPWL